MTTDTVDAEALAEIAYGIFEIVVNRELCRRGSYLFELVESDRDFWENFQEIFTGFRDEYPQLAEALEARFGSTEAIYGQLLAGEGVAPSRTTQMYWIVQDAPDFNSAEFDDELGGKWLIFVDPADADAVWRRVRDETSAGRLGISARVSTAKENPDARDGRTVIYVFTRDWSDEADVMRVRERLRELGVTDRIGYKRNIETYLGEYSEKGKKVTYYSA
ncbi:DUF1917 domain-containing protein [Methanoculleus sp. FWC-SCC1]|uniref:DUF1917 domain-containing protein n=1 Tax=Methanoculleus frigidifontis TaxID=2584085 RepID=A0ABT8MAU2_9EURY|nr:putative phosphothreonine lyase domain-containg protein [Methanoculleus sp. FWC-SCC1]MDN7025059.1 DUF1917 domain-containing protein [Methanoculleus sp. FWC-SCC1]